MEFEGVPSEQKVDAYPHADVDEIIPRHLVEYEVGDHWAVTSVLFSDACKLSLPHVLVSGIHFSEHIPVNRFVQSRRARVFDGCEVFVMTHYVLILEMDIVDVHETKHSKSLVVTFAPVNQFMTCLSLH
jgi:hypothetical protein